MHVVHGEVLNAEPITSDTCINAIVQASGNRQLAAEKLGITTQSLINMIASDPTATDLLNRQLRALTTISTFETLMSLTQVMCGLSTEFEPGDIVKAVTSLTDMIQKLTDSKETTQNVNIVDNVYKMVPPEVKKALLTLIDGAKNAEAS